ncbi:putative aldo-keto reductase 2 [Artemisia annua]|uniref:Putative aldo-keto reductase 2 n=1 Tax=Artemisia annua TaxID=35608 RepID=A0A2U1MZD6_ARTAN|nr:putative aldo-keto reductase 2 [Artemisia annua]
MAQKKGCTPSQLAFSWVLHQGYNVCPIPGTTKIENFYQNIGALFVQFSPHDKAKLESVASPDAFKRTRAVPPLSLCK